MKPIHKTVLTFVLLIIVISGATILYSHTVDAKKLSPTALTTKAYAPNTDIGKLYVNLAMNNPKARKALYAQFSADEKNRIWQLHLSLHRLNANLSPEDDAIFAEAIEVAKKINHANLSQSIRFTNQMKRIYNNATLAFGEAKARDIFNNLGTALNFNFSQGNFAQISGVSFFQEDLEFTADKCGCSTYWNWCGNRTCITNANGCDTKPSGCGPLWGYPCDGGCA